MALYETREVIASAARTTSGVSGAISLGSLGTSVNLWVNVTAVAGATPTLDLSVEWSADGGTTWATAEPADTFAQIAAVKVTTKRFDIKAPVFRLRWAITGAVPSFTFSVREYVSGV